MKNTLFPPIDDLKAKLRFEEGLGKIWLDDQRMLLLHSTSFSALRDELFKALGLVRANSLMWRMGYASGQSDAHFARKIRPGATDDEVFATGPQLHALEGIVHVEPIKLEMDISAGKFSGEFYWDNSFEAEEHLRLHGIESEPVCWVQLGYAAGYTSELMGVEVFYKELECVGCGDQRCKISGKPTSEWEDSESLSHFYKLDAIVENLLSLKDEVQELKSVIGGVGQTEDIVSDSEAIKEILSLLRKAGETDVSVLLLGETGVGKEVFSHFVHSTGVRREKPFVIVNCAALPEDLIEAELFGVEKGAFTGADKSRVGRFERAHMGTIFLDEVGELSKAAQAKLLRVIQSGEFERVGDTRTRKVDVRILAATNVSLEERVSEGEFRADLFYRLNVFPIYIPPLRERQDDIPGLAKKFMQKYAIKHNKRITGITDKLMALLMSYDWPGNIRELKNLIERGVILTNNGEDISGEALSIGMKPHLPSSDPFGGDEFLHPLLKKKINTVEAVLNSGLALEDLEKQVLEEALLRSGGNVSAASRALGMTGPQLRYRLKKYNLISDN